MLTTSLIRSQESRSTLPGSCMFVSCNLKPLRPVIFDSTENSCTCLNVSCCFICSHYHQIAVLSVYHSPSHCPKVAVSELRSILLRLSTCVKYLILANVPALSCRKAILTLIVSYSYLYLYSSIVSYAYVPIPTLPSTPIPCLQYL